MQAAGLMRFSRAANSRGVLASRPISTSTTSGTAARLVGPSPAIRSHCGMGCTNPVCCNMASKAALFLVSRLTTPTVNIPWSFCLLLSDLPSRPSYFVLGGAGLEVGKSFKKVSGNCGNVGAFCFASMRTMCGVTKISNSS